MAIEINNNCNFNRTQVLNNTVTNANNTKDAKISDEVESEYNLQSTEHSAGGFTFIVLCALS